MPASRVQNLRAQNKTENASIGKSRGGALLLQSAQGPTRATDTYTLGWSESGKTSWQKGMFELRPRGGAGISQAKGQRLGGGHRAKCTQEEEEVREVR